MKFFRRHVLTIAALILYWPGIFILTHIPVSVPFLILRLQASDKILHFVAYLFLVFLLWCSINPDVKVNWRKASVWWILFVVVWYGVIDEWLQGYVGRSPDAMDFAADLSGSVTALILLSAFEFWTAALIVTGGAIFAFTNFTSVNPGDLVAIPSSIFHLLSYSFFTVLWMRWMYYFTAARIPELRWVAGALIMPLFFLVLTNLFSLIAIGNVRVSSAIFSAAGITLAVFLTYLILRFRHKVAEGLLSERA